MSLTEAMGLAIAALAGQGDGSNAEPVTADQLEVALLERNRPHRAFRRLTGAAPRCAAGRGQVAAPAGASAASNGAAQQRPAAAGSAAGDGQRPATVRLAATPTAQVTGRLSCRSVRLRWQCAGGDAPGAWAVVTRARSGGLLASWQED